MTLTRLMVGPCGVELGSLGASPALTRLLVGPVGVQYGEFLHPAAAPAVVLTSMSAGGPCGIQYGSFAKLVATPGPVAVAVVMATPSVTVTAGAYATGVDQEMTLQEDIHDVAPK